MHAFTRCRCDHVHRGECSGGGLPESTAGCSCACHRAAVARCIDVTADGTVTTWGRHDEVMLRGLVAAAQLAAGENNRAGVNAVLAVFHRVNADVANGSPETRL